MHKSDKIHAHTIMMHSVQALYCNWDCHWDCLRILGLSWNFREFIIENFDDFVILVYYLYYYFVLRKCIENLLILTTTIWNFYILLNVFETFSYFKGAQKKSVFAKYNPIILFWLFFIYFVTYFLSFLIVLLNIKHIGSWKSFKNSHYPDC